MEIDGIKELQDKLKKFEQDYPKRRAKFLKLEGEKLLGYAKEATYYKHYKADTGFLKAAWGRTEPEDGTITVYNKAEYSRHVEYGHRIKTKNGYIRDKTGKFKFIPGDHMLQRATERLKDNFIEDAKIILLNHFTGEE